MNRDFVQSAKIPVGEINRIKHRRRTTPAQLQVLDCHFQACPKPDISERKRLSDRLEMTVREVQVWVNLRLTGQAPEEFQSSKAENLLFSLIEHLL